MTEGTGEVSQTQDSVSSQPVSTAAPAATPQSTPEERNFRQSEVNDIVKHAKNDAVEKYKRMQTEQPHYAQQKYGENAQQSTTQHSQGMSSEENLRRIAAEEVHNLRDQWAKEAQTKAQEDYATRTVQNFYNKISPGREKYNDFEKVTSDIEYARFPNVVQLLADNVDNSHDVLYELGKDRMKMASIEVLANLSPKDAVIQMQRLSNSIKENEIASKTRQPNEPLSQLRPSNTGTDNGAMSVSDFRKKYKV